jgi:RimJ/RimL family protein N-acetyltransferase
VNAQQATGYAGRVSDVRVTLRPVEEPDLPLLERQSTDPDAVGDFNWSGFRSAGDSRRRQALDGWLGQDDGRLIVLHGPDAAGHVSWQRVTYGIPAWWCWNIGIALLPEFRGKGVGTQAQRILAEYLLDVTPAERIEAYTDRDNVQEQRSLEKAGFLREGIIRSAQFRRGRYRDLVLYSMLRSRPVA